MRANPNARAWAGLAVLSLPCLLVSLDAEVLNLAAPQLTAALRPSSVQLLWIMDSYVFVVAGALIAMGVLGDRIGRRRLLLVGAGFFGAASLLAAFAATPAQLIAARVLMGLSGASLMPSTLALIRVMFADARSRAVALGVWSASFSLGGVASPLIGGVLLEHFWWGSVFVLAVPAVLLLLAVGPVLLPESRDRGATSFDTLGALLSLAAVLIFVYGLKRLAASGWHLIPLAAIGMAVLLGVLFVRRQRRIPQPLLDLTMFRNARVSVALGSNALSFFVLYGTQLAIAQYLQLVLGLSPLRAGLWTLPSVLAYLGSSFLSPPLARRFPVGRVVAAGLVAMAGGFAVLAHGGLDGVVAGTVVFSLGLAPVYILTTDLVVETVRPARAGMAAAVTETGCELGGALGIAILGSLSVAAYRHGMAGSVVPLPAGGTLADAVSVAAGLPARPAEALLHQADAAYGSAFGLMSLTAAVLVGAVAILAAVVLRPAPARVPALPGVSRSLPALPGIAGSLPTQPGRRRGLPAVGGGVVSLPALPGRGGLPALGGGVVSLPALPGHRGLPHRARPLLALPGRGGGLPAIPGRSGLGHGPSGGVEPIPFVPRPAKPLLALPISAGPGTADGSGGAHRPETVVAGGVVNCADGREESEPLEEGGGAAAIHDSSGVADVLGPGVSATGDPSADMGVAAASGLSTANRPAATLAHAESAAFTLSVTCTGEIVEVTSRPAA